MNEQAGPAVEGAGLGAGGGGVAVGVAVVVTVAVAVAVGCVLDWPPDCGGVLVPWLEPSAGAGADGEVLVPLADGWALAVPGRGEPEAFVADPGADDVEAAISVAGGCGRVAATGLAMTLV